MDIKKYNKGEVYWYINPDVKKENYLKVGENQDFLDNRPVLIISDYIDEYNSSVIIIPATTSPHRNGITVNMENSDGEIETTNLMPMKPRLVPIKYLKSYIGKLSPNILDEVYDALDYHLGRTTVVPEYVIVDKKIHDKISKNNSTKKEIIADNSNNLLSSNDKNDYEDIIKIRKTLEGEINISILKSEKDVRSLVYDIRNINKKAVKKIYDSINSYKDKFKCLNSDNKEVAKIFSTNINQAIIIKNLCNTEIAILQLILINKLLTHTISISTFSIKEKVVFLTIENSELSKYIKKGDTLINNYKSQFLKDVK